MGYNFICGILRAYGDSVTPLVFLIISTALNVGLDIYFLASLRMGAKGAAIATVLAQFISVIACSAYTFIRYKELRLHAEDFRAGREDFLMHLKQGIPLGLQFSVLAIGIIVMQGAVVEFDLTESGIMVAARTQSSSGRVRSLPSATATSTRSRRLMFSSILMPSPSSSSFPPANCGLGTTAPRASGRASTAT